jgi:hypothetical protein
MPFFQIAARGLVWYTNGTASRLKKGVKAALAFPKEREGYLREYRRQDNKVEIYI